MDHMDHKVADLKLADAGRMRIDWAESRMPVLRKLREEGKSTQPLKGQRIAGCLHVTKETAVLIQTLVAAGAEVSWSGCNPLSTNDEVAAALAAWGKHLQPGGWVALTEIDNLFGHEPLSARTKTLFEAFDRDSLVAGRYDFHMGRKLRNHLERSGFKVSKMLTLEDQELSFSGPARPEVLDAWGTRFDRMKLLRDFCGPSFEQAREEFLGCLMRADHSSLAKVYCCIATK